MSVKAMTGVTAIKLQPSGEADPVELANGAFVYSTGSLPITDYLQGQIPLNEDEVCRSTTT